MPDRRPDDVWLDRIVLVSLGACMLGGAAGMTVLSILEKPVPPALTMLLGTASGVLLGWFGREKVHRNGHSGRMPGARDEPSWSPEETWPRREERQCVT